MHMPWGISQNSKEGYITERDKEERETRRRCQAVKETVAMSKIREDIKDKLLEGRAKEIESRYSELRKQVFNHMPSTEQSYIVTEVETKSSNLENNLNINENTFQHYASIMTQAQPIEL